MIAARKRSRRRHRPNPLGQKPGEADITAGRELFRQQCELCHAYDGGGKTKIGSGAFPRPPALRVAARTMSDGEIFYHIRNGIRNTAMPAWKAAPGLYQKPPWSRGGGTLARGELITISKTTNLIISRS